MKADLSKMAKDMAFIGVLVLAFALMVPPVDGSTDAQEAEFQAIQDQIDAWCEEYNLPADSVVFWGYADLYGEYNAAGLCAPPNYRPQIYGYGDHCTIVLDDMFLDGRFDWAEECLLWHEFTHALNLFQNGNCSSHGEEFEDLMKDKPLYYIGCIVADWTAISLRLLIR